MDPHAGHDHGAEAGHEDDEHADGSHDEESHEGHDDGHEGEDIDDLLVPEADGGAAEDDCSDCGSHGTGVTGDLERLTKPRCEHGTATIDCDDCRFELGVVKVEPDVARNLLGTATVQRRAAARVIPLTGQVQFDRTRTVEVPAPAAGRVLSLAVELGQRVKAGQLLAVLHSGEIGQAKAEYLGSVTACEIAEKEQHRQAGVTQALSQLLKRIASNADRSMEDDHATPQATSADGYIGEWKAKLLSAAARLRLARVRHERELELEKKGISARSEHEEAHEAYETAKAEFDALVEEVKLNLAVTKLKAENALKQACASVNAAEQRLRVYGLTTPDLAALNDGRMVETFARLEIRAPRAGTVTSLDASAGRILESNAKFIVIAELDNLWVWCDLYARDLGPVAKALRRGRGVPARVTVSSFPGEVFTGSLDYLGSEVDPHSRTVKARIQVSNADGRLRPGMFVDVEVRVPGKGLARIVPRDAVLSDEGRSFVFQLWRDGLWVRRDVTVRSAFGDRVSVEGELPVGATVATRGAFMLKSDVLREKMGAG